MGGRVSRLVFGSDAVNSKHESLWEIAAQDINGLQVEKLGSLVSKKKLVLVVNVAT